MSALTSIFNRYNLVKNTPIFSKLNWFDLQKIANKSRVVQYEKGEVVCRQGDPSAALYCLVSGRIQAYAMNAEGQKRNVEFIRRGMHFGIVSLLTGENHSLSFEAINDSIILEIDTGDFQAILKVIPQLGIELSHSLSRRFRRRTAQTKLIFESTIISIYSPAKGSGSSTYAANLALSLQRETKKEVVLVNISSDMTQGTPVSCEKEGASPQWKKQAVPLKDIVDDYEKTIASITKSTLSIHLLNVNFDPQDSSLVNKISQFVTALVDDYHYVVVDLPNEMDEVVLKTLTQSDMVQLVTMDRKNDLKMTRQVIDELEEELKENFDEAKIQVIVSDRQGTCYLSFEEVNNEIDFNVSSQLPFIRQEELDTAVTSSEMSVVMPHAESEYARAVTKMARKISGVLVGLVLGGGAALGVAHIGVIRVLEQENIPIDIVVGSSMGALLGSFWTTGKNADALQKLAGEFQNKMAILKLFDPVIPISGLIGGHMIKRWLRRRGLRHKTFYGTRIPFKIVAYDLVKRQEIILDSGSLVDAVRKSIGIPGVIEPVLEKDKVIIDGGVLNPLPTNVLTARGIKKIIAVNVLQSPEHVTKGYMDEQKRLLQESQIPFAKNPWHYIKFRLAKRIGKIFTPNISDIIVSSLQASEYVIAEQSAQQADIVIYPDLTGINWFELYKVDELVKRGETAARAALDDIKKLVQES